MDYHVGRNGTQLGVFNDDQLREGIANRSILLTDLVWCEELPDWAPLSEIIEIDEPQASADGAPEATDALLPVEPESAPPAEEGSTSQSPPMLPAANEAPRPPAIPASLPPPNIPTQQPQIAFTGGGKTSGFAIASLVFGLFSFLFGCLSGLPAIICGHLAMGKISRSGGDVGGRGLAIAGLVLGYGMSFFGTAILAGLAIPAFTTVQEKARLMEAQSNARQIIIALKSYGLDRDGSYPDTDKLTNPQTSNDVFRLLFKAGYIDNETIFTAAFSPYKGDGNIGEPPDFKQALEPGENHWSMTKGISDDSSGNLPLVFENPNAPAWPPTWNADAKGLPIPGRIWKSGKIIIGMNDGSVEAWKLESTSGSKVKLPIFDPADPHEILMPAQ